MYNASRRQLFTSFCWLAKRLENFRSQSRRTRRRCNKTYAADKPHCPTPERAAATSLICLRLFVRCSNFRFWRPWTVPGRTPSTSHPVVVLRNFHWPRLELRRWRSLLWDRYLVDSHVFRRQNQRIVDSGVNYGHRWPECRTSIVWQLDFSVHLLCPRIRLAEPV